MMVAKGPSRERERLSEGLSFFLSRLRLAGIMNIEESDIIFFFLFCSL